LPALDGVDLAPSFAGDAEGDPHPELYWEHRGHTSVRAIRSDKWRWMLAGGKGKSWQDQAPRLYGLSNDRGDQNDLTNEHPDVVTRSVERFDAWSANRRPPNEERQGPSAPMPVGRDWSTPGDFGPAGG
jgi:hypothetical protein